MMKISIVEGRTQRRLILEGKLVTPWAAELPPACEKAKADLEGRELVVVVKNLVAINEAGEHALLQLMKDGIKFQGCDVFSKHILRDLARRVRRNTQQTNR
ncbi:MAG TPA: hypothetical protein VK699_14745 [Terriglobales bacterium]|jgi:hypothetical protein|nr:hypothetical protein [Terriglobales bacterium]